MLLGWQPFWGALVQLNPTYQALPLGNLPLGNTHITRVTGVKYHGVTTHLLLLCDYSYW